MLLDLVEALWDWRPGCLDHQQWQGRKSIKKYKFTVYSSLAGLTREIFLVSVISCSCLQIIWKYFLILYFIFYVTVMFLFIWRKSLSMISTFPLIRHYTGTWPCTKNDKTFFEKALFEEAPPEKAPFRNGATGPWPLLEFSYLLAWIERILKRPTLRVVRIFCPED